MKCLSRKKNKRWSDVCKAVGILLASLLLASDVSSEAERLASGGVRWTGGENGVEILWHDDGNVDVIRSTYLQTPKSSIRSDIASAMIIAEEKAKANLVRFFEQEVSTKSTIITKIESEVSAARKTSEHNDHDESSGITITETLTEITSSFARGNISGIFVLDQGYDAKSKQVWVVIGMNERTIEFSKRVRN